MFAASSSGFFTFIHSSEEMYLAIATSAADAASFVLGSPSSATSAAI